MMLKRLLTLATIFIIVGSMQAKDYTITSPNGKLSATISDGDQIIINHQGETVLTVRPAIVSGKETIVFSAGNKKFLGKKQ